jgi:Tol biopolymer transport system component
MRFRIVAHVFCATFIFTSVEAATKLNGPLVTGGQVRAFKIAPSGTHVVYEADQETDEHRELFSRRLNAQAPPQKISGTLGHTGVDWEFGQFRISNDSQWVVFRAFASADRNRIDLFSVPLDGSAPPINLNGPMFGPFGSPPADGDFQLAPDSERVVFGSEPGNGMFSTLIDGSAPRVPLDLARFDIDPMQISPDGKRLIFRHTIQTYNTGLFAQLLDGSRPAMRLDDGSGIVVNTKFPVTSDGSRVVFSVSRGDLRREVHYSAPLNGLGPIAALNDQLLNNGINGLFSPSPYQITPDGNYLVFPFDEGADGDAELFVRTIDGSGPARRITDGRLWAGFQITSDSQRVIYGDPQDHIGVAELFMKSLIGNDSPVKVNSPLSEGYALSGFQITPDGDHVIYGAYRSGSFQYFSRPTDGSTPAVFLYEEPEGPARLTGRQIAPDGSHIVFGVDLDGFFGSYGYDLPETHVLYAVPIAGGLPRPITDVLEGGRYIREFQFTPDGRSVIYLANQDDKNVFELYSVSVIVPEPTTVAMLLSMIILAVLGRRTRQRQIGHEPRVCFAACES